MNLNNIKSEGLNLIIEALLFSSTTDVCAEWSEEQRGKMLDIAKSLYKDNTLLTNIVLYGKQSLSENKENYKFIKNNFKIKIQR